MSTSAVIPQPAPAHTTGPRPLRVRMDNGFTSGPLDGAWWPRSRDLHTEVADLVDHFPPHSGQIARLLFTRPDWNGQSVSHSDHKVLCARGPVNVGSFPHDDTHRVVLVLQSHERLTLLVIPPNTAAHVADELLRQASDDLNTKNATQLLASLALHLDPDPLQVWDDEGGHQQ